MNRLLRGAAGIIGLGSGDPDDREATDDAAATEEESGTGGGEPAQVKSTALAEADVEKLVQAEVDRREAKRKREQDTLDESNRTAAEWERIQKLAAEGDIWALGEIAQRDVRARQAADRLEVQKTDWLRETVPALDAAFLDPLLAALPEDVWKPIVGEGLTTLEDRKAAVEKALAAHKTAAVAEALADEKFVRDLLGSPSFRAAWLKSDTVRQQFLAHVRGDEDYDEPDLNPGVDRGQLAGDEHAEMNARIRGSALSVVSTRPQRRRERGNRDTLER